ncbi:hypothetical protein A3860_32175 [Niastella vici]|uniref:DUF5362 domain-containing protein n=1 Tax=Niastella vici TaxID=1703345 RepID=A0A1V9FQP6_9BACT|nr:DUF5362 family protein [Niastella vici]OQP60660.1 hypothetical protein A3860_32175 [Niastella vici]
METLNQTAPTQDLFSGLQIDHENNSYLNEVARWSKFLSIVGFVFTGLGTLGLLISLFARSSYESFYTPFWQQSGAVVVMIGLLSLCFFPCLYLFKFSNKMKLALRTDDQYSMTTAFKNLKSYFKFVGIFTIVILAIYVIVIIAMVMLASRNSMF